MLDIESYMESFKDSISKRFEKQENNFMNLTDKLKSFEVTQREYKKRLSSLEDQRNADENEDIELQKMKFKSGKLLEIRGIQEKLETLCSRVDHLENLSSTNNNNNGESKDVTTEQPINLGNRQEQQVSTKKAKWSKVKAKTVDYFKTISIPGVSHITTTESYLLKLLWTVVILCVFGFGFDNISQAVADYYKYDKITNIERVITKNGTFPAITICNHEGYSREHYRNGSLVKTDRDFTNLLKHFLDFEHSEFYSLKNKSTLNIHNHLDIFKIYHPITNWLLYDCLRFNSLTNRSIELFKASSIEDFLDIFFTNFYREDISKNEYYNYTFISDSFLVYVGDNFLNSFENLQYLKLTSVFSHEIKIEKVSIETKLPEPYNPCKKSSVDEPYHQTDCIEACTYKQIKNKYNCTFYSTLFSIQDFRQCDRNKYSGLKLEFSASCLKECPLGSCFSEKFTFYSTTTPSFSYFTSFRFYFRELSTLNITQIPKTDGFTFLNNIGGGLGLFMGIAFPTLIEFFQFILEIVLIIFIRKIN